MHQGVFEGVVGMSHQYLSANGYNYLFIKLLQRHILLAICRSCVMFRYSSRAPTSEHWRWEPDSASDTLIFWNKDLECINGVENKRVKMRLRRVVIGKKRVEVE